MASSCVCRSAAGSPVTKPAGSGVHRSARHHRNRRTRDCPWTPGRCSRRCPPPRCRSTRARSGFHRPTFSSADSGEIIKQYSLPERFFFLPNQFWRHKNHQVVLDAVAALKSRGLDVVIAASGSKDDPRDPAYFDSIMRQISERSLSHNFRYLGMIPLSHVYALLRSSVALINPSRFEGWSTTVEEAKSFGVPMILSDLDVHREQTAGMAMYFGTDDPASLADRLIQAAQDAEPFVRNLVPGLEDRVSMFAADFAHTICSAKGYRRSIQTET